ncbi:hypothetical protein D2E44_19190 [Mycobacteroides abscessus]|nr:hypothetical protein D2E44_19190 [Mycobacteroides abscessus]
MRCGLGRSLGRRLSGEARTHLDVCVPVTYVAGDYAPVAVPWARIADQLRPGMLKQLRAD